MRILLTIFFISFNSWSFTQDTIRNLNGIIIYQDDRIIQKEFLNSKKDCCLKPI